MNELNIVILALTLILGGIIGAFFYAVRVKSRDTALGTAVSTLEKDKVELVTKYQSLNEAYLKVSTEKDGFSKRIVELEKSNSRIEAEKASIEQRLTTHKAEIEELQIRFTEKFENLANRILEEKSRQFQNTGKSTLENIVTPLKVKITEFHQSITNLSNKESEERIVLTNEIKNIAELNRQMSEDAQKLTTALKGDSKTQGDWGEFVLELILERSGLRAGEEYIVQGKGLNLQEDGKRFKPDIVIKLPEGRHLIVDSKVTLTSYEQYVNETDEALRSGCLGSFHQSVSSHVDELSEKHYHALEGISSPDIVLMFIPIESAFGLAIQSKKLFYEAWEKKIMIVSPVTLLATLKTVASIWKIERRNRNTMEIARQGGQLYDKFVGFVDDLVKIGKSIDDSQNVYTQAMSKLKHGKGNLITRAEKLRDLGAKATKSLKAEFTPEEAEPLMIEQGNTTESKEQQAE